MPPSASDNHNHILPLLVRSFLYCYCGCSCFSLSARVMASRSRAHINNNINVKKHDGSSLLLLLLLLLFLLFDAIAAPKLRPNAIFLPVFVYDAKPPLFIVSNIVSCFFYVNG